MGSGTCRLTKENGGAILFRAARFMWAETTMAIITATERPAVRLIDPDAELEFDPDDVYDGPSRSQKKRDVEALQDLGTLLVKLPDAQSKGIELPDELRAAGPPCRKITQNSALRQLDP